MFLTLKIKLQFHPLGVELTHTAIQPKFPKITQAADRNSGLFLHKIPRHLTEEIMGKEQVISITIREKVTPGSNSAKKHHRTFLSRIVEIETQID